MIFTDFKAKLIYRILVLTGFLSLFLYLIQSTGQIISAIIVLIAIVSSIIELVRFVTITNRKLTRFLESVKYSDFISGFASDNNLGQSFRDLNLAFNDVLEAFRKARSEKEEHWQYLNTVIQHIGTGLLSFDSQGKVQLINTVARNFLDIQQLYNIHEIKNTNPKLYDFLISACPGSKAMHRVDAKTHLAIHTTELKMRGKVLKLVAFQNIQSELQQNEIDAWQNLTKVLRHEIMNSITPIASLTATLKDILLEDLKDKGTHFELNEEGMEDLQEGLRTIESRSQGLINFIDAYRDYTTIPEPSFGEVNVLELFDHISQLMKVEIRKANAAFSCSCPDAKQTIYADIELIEQVIINLVKNAIEAVANRPDGEVSLIAKKEDDGMLAIVVIDNGEGIVPEALERIFIPFFTTKKTGSGIGLSLSRQIIQMHNGTLTVASELSKGSEFSIKLWHSKPESSISL